MHARSFNLAVVAGRISTEPEYKTLGRKVKGETQLIRFCIATNVIYPAADGTMKETGTFHRIVVFGGRAKWLMEKMSKGDLVLVKGRIDINSWKDPEGNPRRIVQILGEDVIFLEKPKKVREKEDAAKADAVTTPSEVEPPDTPEKDEPEDEAPF